MKIIINDLKSKTNPKNTFVFTLNLWTDTCMDWQEELKTESKVEAENWIKLFDAAIESDSDIIPDEPLNRLLYDYYNKYGLNQEVYLNKLIDLDGFSIKYFDENGNERDILIEL